MDALTVQRCNTKVFLAEFSEGDMNRPDVRSSVIDVRWIRVWGPVRGGCARFAGPWKRRLVSRFPFEMSRFFFFAHFFGIFSYKLAKAQTVILFLCEYFFFLFEVV